MDPKQKQIKICILLLGPCDINDISGKMPRIELSKYHTQRYETPMLQIRKAYQSNQQEITDSSVTVTRWLMRKLPSNSGVLLELEVTRKVWL